MTRKSKRIGRVQIFGGRKRTKDEYMGRFGGGWQYKLGITAGDASPRYGRTILVALWTDEYCITIHPKKAATRPTTTPS